MSMDQPQELTDIERLGPPPEITLTEDSSFEEVMAELRGFRTWMERLFWLNQQLSTTYRDSHESLRQAIALAASREADYVSMSNETGEIWKTIRRIEERQRPLWQKILQHNKKP